MPVRYTGEIPDPFAPGRGVLVDVAGQRQRRLRRPGQYADHEVPLQVPGSVRLVLMGSATLMAGAGRVLLILCLLSSVYGLGASLYGARSGRGEWVDSGRRAMYSILGMSAIAFVILDVAFISSDFSYNIVASGSSTTTPFFYRAAAIWSTQQGSLLLWVMLLSFWSSLALLLTRRRVREIVPYAQSVLFGLAVFFIGLIVLFANPFATSASPPAEGAGLDPLLRHTTMMIHPPMLYSGFTLLLVPVRVLHRRADQRPVGAEWIQVTRRFALAGVAVPGRRAPARRALVLHRAGLGRLLGLGSGGERGADAVAGLHRVHPLDHDPGEAGDAEGVERLAGPARPGRWRSSATSWCARGSSARSTRSSRTRRSTSRSWC